MEDPEYGDHPVAGTRQFGFELQLDCSYDFFVRGVDRIDSRGLEISAAAFTLGNRFSGSDSTWKNFQKNLTSFLNEMSPDSTTIVDETIWRPDWDDVEDVLNENKPISDLDGCE